jgi:hypothetical protein
MFRYLWRVKVVALLVAGDKRPKAFVSEALRSRNTPIITNGSLSRAPICSATNTLVQKRHFKSRWNYTSPTTIRLSLLLLQQCSGINVLQLLQNVHGNQGDSVSAICAWRTKVLYSLYELRMIHSMAGNRAFCNSKQYFLQLATPRMERLLTMGHLNTSDSKCMGFHIPNQNVTIHIN